MRDIAANLTMMGFSETIISCQNSDIKTEKSDVPGPALQTGLNRNRTQIPDRC